MESSVRESRPVSASGAQPAGIELGPRFKNEVTALVGGLDLSYCFQCGVCSGSCPTLDRMEYGPRKIMQMIRLGMADRVLRSRDIWFCVSCYSCAARCPQGIDITDVMAALRNMAIARGLAKDKEATFSKIFVEVLKRHGRMFELEVMLRYFLAETDLGDLFQQAELGINMVRKRKLALRPERIENAEELAEIAERMSGGGER